MSDSLRFVPPRVRLVNPESGIIERQWYLFLQGVFDRIGGATGNSTGDIEGSLFEDAGSSETNATMFIGLDAVNQQPPLTELCLTIQTLQAEVAAQRDLIAELTKSLQGVQQSQLL